MTIIETTTSKFDDPRIEKLPRWAQELMAAGAAAERSAVYWNERYDEKCNEIDKLREDHAREHGAERFDTWTSTYTTGDSEVRHGIGVGTAVHFGDGSDVCEMYTVTYTNGGLNITGQGSGFALKLPRFGNDTLRVDAD